MGNKPFSLVLGGGAARGLAHIGVIRKLEELKQEPEEIIGTSIGSLVGAFYALGHTSKEMESIAEDLPLLKLIDIELKSGSLKGEKLMKYFETFIGNASFSDTKIPLKIITTDIDTGEKVVLQEGQILSAIRASIGIPGVFRPYHYGDRFFVDGGLNSNLAIEEANPSFPIIAVSVVMSIRKVNRNVKGLIFDKSPITHTYGIIRKTLAIMMAKNEATSLRSRGDTHLIRPEREDIDYYEIKKVKPMIEAGYSAAHSLEAFFSS